jgi:hypothetical protein
MSKTSWYELLSATADVQVELLSAAADVQAELLSAPT